jgi:predicted DNA-binding protein (MmcQ/YjbR family)
MRDGTGHDREDHGTLMAAGAKLLARLRKLCLALPGAVELVSHGEPTFKVKKVFAMYANPKTHHGRGRPGVWIKAQPVNQQLLLIAHPDRFFVPPYVGPAGWIGVWLDGPVDWPELDGLLREGYRLIAPKKLVAQLDGIRPSPTRRAASRRA